VKLDHVLYEKADDAPLVMERFRVVYAEPAK